MFFERGFSTEVILAPTTLMARGLSLVMIHDVLSEYIPISGFVNNGKLFIPTSATEWNRRELAHIPHDREF